MAVQVKRNMQKRYVAILGEVYRPTTTMAGC